MTPDQTCIQRERYGIPYTDPDLVNSIAARLAASNRLEWLCDKSGIWITPDMIAFNADQTMAWGDRDYEDPPLASIEQHLLRVQEVLDEVAFEKRQVWVEKQVKSSAERAKHKAVDQLPNALEELFSKTPKAGRKEATENLGALLKKIIRKAGLRPKLGDMLTTVVFCNQNGFKSRRFTKPKETLKSVRRDYLMHHGWDGKDDEPEWATDIRVSRVIFTEAFDGHGRGERWIVAPIPNPKETVSSYVDPSPGVGDDGNYRWVGSALVFDPHWAFN